MHDTKDEGSIGSQEEGTDICAFFFYYMVR